jgi:hypothetical protein
MAVDREAWTCPDCLKTYRADPTDEVYVWSGRRRSAQVLHASKHGRSALVINRRRLTDPPIDYGPRGPAHTVVDVDD